jgi:hypothetical protein
MEAHQHNVICGELPKTLIHMNPPWVYTGTAHQTQSVLNTAVPFAQTTMQNVK